MRHLLDHKLLYLTALLACLLVPAWPAWGESQAVFEQAKDSVVQVVILDEASGAKSSFGSGFFVGPPGYVVTNFHVISDLVFDAGSHRAIYRTVDETEGDLQLVHVDVVNDLAILRSDQSQAPRLAITTRTLHKGAAIHSLGHPHDLGLSVVEGNYNGLLEDSFIPRIHFTGSLNPGMSGGPALNPKGELVGVNVAAMGDQVSFLVPARYVARLVKEATTAAGQDFRALVREQLSSHQEIILRPILARTFPVIEFGPFAVPGELSEVFECWGKTHERRQRLFESSTHKCSTADHIYLTSDHRTGNMEFTHEYFHTKDLDPFRFYAFLETHMQSRHVSTAGAESRVTAFACHEGLLREPALIAKTVVCLRGHKELDRLYDFFLLLTTTQDRREALYSVVRISGVSFETGQAFLQGYLNAIEWRDG